MVWFRWGLIMRRVSNSRDGVSTRRAKLGRGLLEAAAIVAVCGAMTACSSSSYETKGVRDYDVGAIVQDDAGQPVPGLNVQVWIVDGDQPLSQREPLALSPSVETNSQGLALWTYQSVAEPQIVGYEVRRSTGELLLEVQPDRRNDFGPTPSRVILNVEL